MADMRDRLAEIIRNAHMTANPLSQVGYAEADALLANGVILQEWISVEDRLPDEGGYYLIHQKRKSWFDAVIQTARWHKTEQRFLGAQAGCFMAFVTHWMPLPQPPKEAEKALREKDE